MRDSARRPDGGTEEQKPVPFSVTFTRMVRTLGRQELGCPYCVGDGG